MTDRSEGMDHQAQDNTDEPARAFETLSRLIVRTEKYAREIGAEMTVIRKDVEAAFEAFEKFLPPKDYTDDIARLDKQLGFVAQNLETLEKLPAIRYGPEHYARVLEMTGECLSDHAGRHLESKGRVLERVTNDLRAYVTNARLRRQQTWWVWGAAGAGLVAGMLLTLYLHRLLPGSVDIAVAATAMNADRWNAEASLMQSGRPAGWRNLMAANDLVRDNRDALNACLEAAARAKKEQRCTITVTARAP